MRLAVQELKSHLAGTLAPIYLLSGDEPLQMGEAADAIRACARSRGYSSREILEAGARFDWGQLVAEANSLSLFAERRILDLRIVSGKPGADGGKALSEYAERPPEDILLLITMPKLDKGQSNSKWFKALQRSAVLVQIWPIQGARLPAWIKQRMQDNDLTPEPGVVDMLVERIEGNLLAAAQEIDKLRLLYGAGNITLEQLAESVADSARFDVFDLVDSALAGGAARCNRVLTGLRAEGTPAAVVLWALSREIRVLCSLALEVRQGRSPQQAVAGRRDIWDKRKPLVAKGLKRLDVQGWRSLLQACGRTDRTIKGQEPGNAWRLLQDIATRMAGARGIARLDGTPPAQSGKIKI